MNDLQTLRAALTPDEPDQDVVDRSRHRLQNRIHGGRSSSSHATAAATCSPASRSARAGFVSSTARDPQ